MVATTHRLAVLRADVEAHEAAVPDHDPALFLVDLHHGMLDAIAGHASLLDVASGSREVVELARPGAGQPGGDLGAGEREDG